MLFTTQVWINCIGSVVILVLAAMALAKYAADHAPTMKWDAEGRAHYYCRQCGVELREDESLFCDRCKNGR